jgi:tetratricopeptide (TPR) repeat protein
MIVFLIVMGFWEFKWKPQYRPFYENGVGYYQKAKYILALGEFERAYQIAPNSTDVIMMLGWTNLKLNRFEDARFYFDRVLKIDPRIEEAQMGSAFVALETGRGKVDVKAVNRLLGERRGDPNVRILAAGALVQQGRNFEAADIYRGLLHDRSYGEAAEVALQDMFGLKGFNDPIPEALPPVSRPEQLQVRFRAGQGAMWRLGKNGWEKFYVTGINLGPGAPGYYPSKPPTDGEMYATWLRYANQTNASVLRAYTLLPPGFYRAYKHYLDGGGRMELYQQIWISDPPHKDLWDPSFVEQTKAEIRYAVDAIHGHGNIPPKAARGYGIYNLDVSDHVAAWLLGRELEPSLALQTNLVNPGKTQYDGKYVSISGGNPTETWMAEMLDYLISYEADTYNWQRPAAIVNWPPTDPLTHPTETSTPEEIRLRNRRGENLPMPKGFEDDADVVSIDEAKFRPSPGYQAGMFASYHVYPYYPDFLLLDPYYLKARDSEGPNPMFGYIRDLRAHMPFPLLITEFGIPTSIGISHFHPLGWNHGGHTEAEQGELLTRMARSIREAGCAGGFVFELIDEWYKHNWLTVHFEHPYDRAALWLNELDPEKFYGVVGFHTSKWALFTGNVAGWEQAQTLYQSNANVSTGDAYDGARSIRRVQADIDEAFLYLRITVACLDCPKGRGQGLHLDKAAYAVAFNTLPDLSGFKQMPFGGYRMASGANFLLYLAGGTSSGKLLVAENYYPYREIPKPNIPSETDLVYRRAYTPALVGEGDFRDFIVETNRRRYARDGKVYPPQRYSRSQLRYGDGNPSNPDYDSLAEWYADVKSNTIYVRIPWGKLLFTDPSSRQVFFGFDDKVELHAVKTPGIDITVFALKPTGASTDLKSMSVVASFPAAVNGEIRNPERLTWKDWERVTPDPYFKTSFSAVVREFAAENRGQALEAKPQGRSGRSAATGKKR